MRLTPPPRHKYRNTAQQAMVSLLYAAAHLERLVAEACEAHGVTHEQYNVLRILRGAQPDGLPRYEIASRMVYRAPDVTRLLDRLEARSLVERMRSDEDRRVSLTIISRAGLGLLERMESDIVAVHERVAESLTAAERRELARLCDLLVR